MTLHELIRRKPVPEPWTEGDNIPWHEEKFSKRMLQEHLSQEHDAASRRTEKIDWLVDWVHNGFLKGSSTKILDLGCGPGFYSNRLARKGHDCVGIDYSPASIAYARREAEQDRFATIFHHQDIREADYGSGFGLVMQIYGELNVFSPADAVKILEKAYDALVPGGLLLVEPHTFECVKRIGGESSAWNSSSGGLFSEQPHLLLKENFWDESRAVTTIRYFVIDAASSEVARYAQSLQAYTDDGYRALLSEAGFHSIQFYSASGKSIAHTDPQGSLFFIVCRK